MGSYPNGDFESVEVSGFAKACVAVTLIHFIKNILINYLQFKVSNISYKKS